jgi:ribosomal protein S18 acetylase RimI-like enzyme
MFERHYQCVGIYYQRKLVGVCGLWILTKYYSGRHLEPDNVYIKPEFRNLGIGTKLNEWLIAFARQNNCNAIELNCYNDNNQGQTFWETNNFQVIGLHYSKKV